MVTRIRSATEENRSSSRCGAAVDRGQDRWPHRQARCRAAQASGEGDGGDGEESPDQGDRLGAEAQATSSRGPPQSPGHRSCPRRWRGARSVRGDRPRRSGRSLLRDRTTLPDGDTPMERNSHGAGTETVMGARLPSEVMSSSDGRWLLTGGIGSGKSEVRRLLAERAFAPSTTPSVTRS